MVKELIDKIDKIVESLGQSIERIELGDDGCSVFIKIEESDHLGDDYYLCGEKGTIIESLIDIKNSCYEQLKNKIRQVENEWQENREEWQETCKDTDRYLKQQGWS